MVAFPMRRVRLRKILGDARPTCPTRIGKVP